MNHTYEFTYEKTGYLDAVVCSAEVRVIYDYSPGTLGKVTGPPEDCYPPESPEIEITAVEVEAFELFGRGKSLGWEAAAEWLSEAATDEAMADHFDEMCEHARDDREPDPDAMRDRQLEREA